MIDKDPCLCGSYKPYEQCCGQYHQQYNAPTAETLMRSRYSAFCLSNMEYISKTMAGKAAQDFNAEQSKQFASSVYWLGLEIRSSYPSPNQTDTAYVEFIARFMVQDTIQAIHELSEFKQTNNQWYYVDGVHPKNATKTVKISRNQPCPCNSLKKFKNCHGKVNPQE